jgi:hypothetical protein
LVILIVASELDSVVIKTAAKWPGFPAVVLTPRDLCTKGWCIETQDFENGNLVANGVVTPVRRINGVVTLLQCVTDYELFKIEEVDRKYAASEINAFLVYFLSRLTCRVLNRPSAYCLSGPSWHPTQWMWACRRAGIPTETALASSAPLVAKPESEPDFRRSISIVGDSCLGGDSPYSANVAQLANFARVEFLTARFTTDGKDEVLRSISTIPDLQDEAISNAVHEHLMSPQ